MMIELICKQCGKKFKVYPYRKGAQFCSYSCRNKSKTGEKAFNWKGGRRNHSAGYVEVYSPDHPGRNHKKTVLEHRLVMENHIGRHLLAEEVVHHRNGIKNDNRIENLALFVNESKHQDHHWNVKQAKDKEI